MYLDDNKSYLLFGKDLNSIIAILQSVSDRNPDIDKLNELIQKLKDMRSYEDMLNDFIFGDQKTYPRDKKEIGKKDNMTLEEMMKDLELRFMDERDKDNGKN
jgi:uncharacterized protein YihD (DUF1040 family)